MTRTNLWKLFSIAAVLALLVVACGGDDDDDPTATSPSAGGAPTATRESSGGGGDSGGGENGGDSELIAMGEELYNSQGCAGCHTTDGSGSVGPTWQGLWMSDVPLDDGTTVVGDAEYIEESIVDPNAKIREGFQPIMPPYDGMSAEEIEAIVAFIESLA